ncbi:hypothetical protein ABBQ38_009556 [Trebouxia sp. C0009 RCD-2024]
MTHVQRIETLSRHLTTAVGVEMASIADELADNTVQVGQFNPRELYEYTVGDNIELRDRIFEFLKDDIFKPNHYLSLMEFRQLTLERLQKFVAQQFFVTKDYLDDPRKFQAGLAALAFADYSLCIKAGVHFTLCGGTIAKLGTEKHHTKLLPLLDDLTLPGCFGMTELGHGSNVMGIQTQAVYDKASDSFIINTPDDTASKFWIGGAAQHGKICTVFAQLTVDGKWQGPHVFVVRLRDNNSQLTPGVKILDNGPKMGLNGVDNGQIWFDHVKVPRDALLDKYASVSAEGVYTSSIKSVSQRFGMTVGGLTTGRLLIAQGAVDACKVGTSIAIRYSCKRPQFGEKMIMEYITQQRRLLPGLATTYAMQISMARLRDLAARGDPQDGKAIHVLSSGLKAAATWSRVEILQSCRECCGGQGFLAANKIGPMKTDMDVDVTFEGDNTVMMQQVSKALLDTFMKRPKKPQAVSVAPGAVAAPEAIGQLLQYREDSLTAQLGGSMARAMKGAGPSGRAMTAANEAFEADLDEVVALGWAHVEAHAYRMLLQQAQEAPPSLGAPLQLLGSLYGLTRLERSMAHYLASGVLQGSHATAVRAQINRLCGQLSANSGRLALQLCEGFGIPDHLLQAPIAFDWQQIGTSWKHV